MSLLERITEATPLAVTDLDPDLAFFTVIVFVLTLIVLWRFAWKPITEGLDKREKGIADQIAQAKSDAEQAQQTLRDYEAKLSTAAEEAKVLLTQAREEASHAKERIMVDAKEAADRERQRVVADIEAAKNQAIRELAQKSVDSAVQLAGHLVRKELNAELHAKLIEESLARFGSEN